MNYPISLTSTQKAAALLVAMGKERAGKIIAQCSPDEVRSLMVASEGLKNIPEMQLEELVDEFENAMGANLGMLESAGSLQAIIEDSLTPEQKSALNQGPKAAEMALRNASIWELLDRVDQDDLIEFLCEENQQVSAYVLSRLPAKKSAELISLLEGETRQAILVAMISSRPAVTDAVKMLEQVVTERFARVIGLGGNSGGSQKSIAGVFNELDSELSDNLFEELADVVNPHHLQSVKSFMFRFEDLINLEKSDVAKVVDEIPQDLLMLSMRDATPELTDLILNSLGQRTRRMVEAELKTPSTASDEDIKIAKKEIASLVLGLSSNGTIKIPEPDLAA